ncbi:MAG: dienelactone hydrolase family protein [Pegethrix bostrychoides GSE-TBD4-15B]|jgi:carboxymethylenebutenolidase|uniref:Dienelactone hydrolase family protein n=1 Tax=Pegethrix bostrychoides GSE-TBD4-15B TaxID=2839662 RepID=A0A951U5B0_9CYAN|nr:dienelactone hydrolase family protein [Pegethrix bostrychoides GSE-TBD4-15B]
MSKKLGLILVGLVALLGTILFQQFNSPTVALTHSQQVGQALMQSHQGDLPVPTGAVAQMPSMAVSGEQVSYGTDSNPMTGYLARPADSTESLPALIVIHEWWGLNDNIQMMTDRLAGEGYMALAVDLYGGEVAENPEQAKMLVQSATANPQQIQENLRQAYAYLEGQQATKIGSIGWCFGGSRSLETALLFPDKLDAAVIYYGGQLVTDADQLAALEMPILGIFGALDDNPSPETVQQFETALKSAGKSPEIYIYDGADHAFANSSGTRYNAAAAEDAWTKTTAFLERHLKE